MWEVGIHSPGRRQKFGLNRRRAAVSVYTFSNPTKLANTSNHFCSSHLPIFPSLYQYRVSPVQQSNISVMAGTGVQASISNVNYQELESFQERVHLDGYSSRTSFLPWIVADMFSLALRSHQSQQTFQGMNIIAYVMPLPAIVLACVWTALVLTITVIYFLPQRSPMPMMCGSARVVLASCCELAELPEDGIMWGDITETLGSSKRKAGFSQTAGAIREGELYL